MGKPKVLITSTSLLNDRVILYNDFLKELSKYADVYIWPLAWDKPAYTSVNMEGVYVEKFPKVKPMRFMRGLLRRLNDYTWDAKKLAHSRESFWAHTDEDEVRSIRIIIRNLAKVVNALGLAVPLENLSEKIYRKEIRSEEALQRLKVLNPDMVITMSAFFSIEPGIINEALRLKIPVLPFITAWDNISTKNRLMFSYHGFFVWSEEMKVDLDTFYPQFRNKPWYLIGAPQYDVFKNPEFYQSKEDFCKENNLNPNLPIVVYALGSPNLFDEFPGALEFVKLAATGAMGDIQVIVRPHPMKHNDPGLLELNKIYNKVLVQAKSNAKTDSQVFTHDKTKIIEWMSTYKYADVIIQLGSTVAIDGCLLDRPVINLNFDPSGNKNQLVKEVNTTMRHFAPLVKMEGMWEVQDYKDMCEAVVTYIKHPELHKEGRRRIAEYVCTYNDGGSGVRFANAVISYLQDELHFKFESKK